MIIKARRWLAKFLNDFAAWLISEHKWARLIKRLANKISPDPAAAPIFHYVKDRRAR